MVHSGRLITFMQDKDGRQVAIPPSPQAAFGEMLHRVAGQAFAATGYSLQEHPMQQARGLFRYVKSLANGVSAYVEFQLLHYQVGGPSRFRVNLLRNIGDEPRAETNSTERVEITLAELLWTTFDVQQLGSPEHWWLVQSPAMLAQSIADAGRYVFAFGIPWLEGALSGEQEESDDENVGSN